MKGQGPIPSGIYYVPTKRVSPPNPDGYWSNADWNYLHKNRWFYERNVIEKPASAWGDFSVRLIPGVGTNTHGRVDFNIHGGRLPNGFFGSAGCIDLMCGDTPFFRELDNRGGGERMILYVNYTGNKTKNCPPNEDTSCE